MGETVMSSRVNLLQRGVRFCVFLFRSSMMTPTMPTIRAATTQVTMRKQSTFLRSEVSEVCCYGIRYLERKALLRQVFRKGTPDTEENLLRGQL